MRRGLLSTVVVAGMLALPCQAQSGSDAAIDRFADSLWRLERLLADNVEERDVERLFGFLRRSFRDSLAGRPQEPLPRELLEKQERIAGQLRREAPQVVDSALDVFEALAREALRESRRRP